MGKKDKKRQRREERERLARERLQQAAPDTGESAPGPRVAAHAAVCLVLLLLHVLLYYPALDLGFFHLDDLTFVQQNPVISEWSFRYLIDMTRDPYIGNLGPTHILTYVIDYAIDGYNPFVFHLSSLVWAGLASMAVYWLACRLSRSMPIALFAALLFTAHPAHVEVTVWITNRKDAIAVVFGILSMLGYFAYRDQANVPRPGRSGAPPRALIFYGLSVLMFLLGLGAKQSIAPLFIVLLLFDLLREKRRGWWLLCDKIPFALITLWLGLHRFDAEPSSGLGFDLSTFLHISWANLWLLGGFGDYVIYRARPTPFPLPMELLRLLACAGAGGALLWGNKKLRSITIILMAWTAAAFIPPVLANKVHPVVDRYLYFATVPFCLWLAWYLLSLAQKSRFVYPTIAILIALVSGWVVKTAAYVREWDDPRSVWYAATGKSQDANVFFYLGVRYQDTADRLESRAMPDDDGEELRRLAAAMQQDPKQTGPLIAEWEADLPGGPLTRAFITDLRESAWEQFERADAYRGTATMPNLYFRRGKVLMDLGRFPAAKQEFAQAYEQAQRHTYVPIRNELTVRSYYALGVIAWRERNYPEAKQWIRRARDEQVAVNGRWVPDIDAQLSKLERIAPD